MELGRLKHLLIDLDGVVYRGERPLDGAADFFCFLRQRQLRFSLITNNSTKTAGQFADKLLRIGIPIDEQEIITSAEATADYLGRVARRHARVLVLGGEGLHLALRRAGFVVSSRRPEYVVVGLDERLTYGRLAKAAQAIRTGARFVASNCDATWPAERGELPGAGAIVAALQTASGVAPTVVGKPQPLMLEAAMRRMGATRETTAIVGDRLETDILAGHRLGICTMLVLTGVTSRDELGGAQIEPDFVFEDLGDLRRALAVAQTQRAAGESSP